MNEQHKTTGMTEQKILAEEKAILAEVKKEEVIIKKAERRTMFFSLAAIGAVVTVLVGLLIWHYQSGRVYIENAQVTAPTIQLAPSIPGTLEEVFVHEGDQIAANTPVARVDNQVITSGVAGIVIEVKSDIGKRFNPGEYVVAMINPNDLRIVGRLAEDKGLTDVAVGQPVVFTVDAFGSQKWYGTVDEISPTSRDAAITFSISDKRETNEFNVKARFDVAAYNQLKNGMSAKMWVLTR